VCLLCLVALTKEEGSNYLFLRWKHRSNEQGIWRVQSSISSKSIYSIEASRLALVKAESIFLLQWHANSLRFQFRLQARRCVRAEHQDETKSISRFHSCGTRRHRLREYPVYAMHSRVRTTALNSESRDRKSTVISVYMQLGQSCAPIARIDLCDFGVCGRMDFVFRFV
jgi:hypothetical protein